MKNKWILFGVATLLIIINLTYGDFSAYKQLSAGDLVPVIAIAMVTFLLKAGVLSAILIGLKKLLRKIRKGDQ